MVVITVSAFVGVFLLGAFQSLVRLFGRCGAGVVIVRVVVAGVIALCFKQGLTVGKLANRLGREPDLV